VALDNDTRVSEDENSQFGFSEAQDITEPGAVAPDARANFRNCATTPGRSRTAIGLLLRNLSFIHHFYQS
jgi:hypothetical protein